ncbi:NAD-dependent epimerase/dehydratase family protein [Polaromonas sp. AER18D-145]|uniref:NAD-dependent epimerase/dehydratase family protein n=1 Tax=Polaromonas sp. AER18D-145 TaxID=1977060 RepID=UPI000BBBD525|nr:NAD-dependent epimerase/dehydratase family protein [Polaromonas sp. AER18D-145]
MPLNAAVLGAGFIGLNFIRFALRYGYNLRVLDHKACPAEFEGRLLWVKGDLGDTEAVWKTLDGIEIVFHFVSSTVPGDVTDEGAELIQNVVQTLQLLKLCVRQGVRRIVFVSSASVYGMQDSFPVPESASTDPISSHGIHKLAIEKYLQLYKHQHGLDCKIIRLSNPYGPGQSIKGRQGFIAIAVGKILAGEEVEVRGDGSTVRDYIYIDDVCTALHLAGGCDSNEVVFNVGTGKGVSLNEIIDAFRVATAQPIRIVYTNARFADIPTNILDVARAKTVLGCTPQVTLSQGLARTLAYHGIKMSGS